MLVRNAVRFVILCAFVTGALAQTRISIPNAIPRLPEPARVQAKRKQQADIKARGQRVRDAAGAIGLHGIIASGSFKTPGALYGSPGSGRVPGASAADAAHNFLQAFAPVYGLSAGDINSIAVRERPGFVTGNREVIVQQKVAGRNLYGAGVRLHLGPNGEFIAAVGELYGNLRWAGNSKLTSADAILQAANLLDRVLPPKGLGPVQGAHVDEANVSEVAYPNGEEARPAFLCEMMTAANGIDMFDVVIDGISGVVLEVVSRTAYSQGQVFRDASSMPQSPQPNLTPGIVPPSPNPPLIVPRVTIPFDSFLSGTTLSGNVANVREYQAWTGGSRSASSGNAITAPTGSDFSFPLTPGSGDIRNYPQASGTNLFYLLNYLHDYFNALGFDVAHGNFEGNDPVIGFVQQGSGLAGSKEYSSDNANMSTPADGQSPLMAMYVFGGTGTAPNRSFVADSALDPDVVFHEFTHGVTERLDPSALPYAGQPGAFNEGNSDFFSLNIQAPSTAPVAGSYPLGGYSTQDFANGIRWYPYSTNMAVNPLTYADLAVLHGFPEVHNDGEIWTSAMWQVRGALINALGFSEGRLRAGQLDVDALQLLPDNATFVDFRNAIVAADVARYAGADLTAIWNGFAVRGLGALAQGGYDGYSLHVLEDFSVASTAAHVGMWESAFYAGETLRVVVNDSNAVSKSVTLTTSSGDHETIALTQDGQVWAGNINTAMGAPNINNGTVEIVAGDVITATTTDTNTGGATPVLTTTAAAHAPYSISTTASQFDASASPSPFAQGDEVLFYFDLDFSFPFFGQNYSRIYVNDNGQVSFGYANSSIRQRGLGGQGVPPSIAPFSVDLDCNLPRGMYYYSDSGRFTLRWACKEYSSANLVNVALNIFPNGGMRFDYGSGNTLSGNDYYTSLPDIATVGFVRGTETFTQSIPGYDGVKNLANAASVVFAPVADQNIAVCPAAFTDPTLIAGVTAIKAVHIDETRLCVNALRTLAGLPHVSWTPAGNAITASTMTEMRNALDPARSLLSLPAIPYARPTITSGMTILANDLQEIRNGTR